MFTLHTSTDHPGTLEVHLEVPNPPGGLNDHLGAWRLILSPGSLF
jgi:hypothetical protein